MKYQNNTQQVDKITCIGNIKLVRIKLIALLNIKLLAGELEIIASEIWQLNKKSWIRVLCTQCSVTTDPFLLCTQRNFSIEIILNI